MACFFCENLDRSRIMKESGKVLVLLNLFPAVDGHVLVVPREHFCSLDELPDDVRAEMFAEAIRAAAVLKTELGVSSVNILINEGPDAGQTVEHMHMHVFPRREGDNLEIRRKDNSRVPVSDRMSERLKAAFA